MKSIKLWGENMAKTSDLALESYESAEKTKLDGVIVKEKNNITTVEVINENGARALSKPVGKYVTLEVESFVNNTDIFDGRLDEFAGVLTSMLPENLSSVQQSDIVHGLRESGLGFLFRHFLRNFRSKVWCRGDKRFYLERKRLCLGVVTFFKPRQKPFKRGIVTLLYQYFREGN